MSLPEFNYRRAMDTLQKGVLIEVLQDLDPDYVFSIYKVTLPDGYMDGRISFHKKGEPMESGSIVTYALSVGLDVRDLQQLIKIVYASKS